MKQYFYLTDEKNAGLKKIYHPVGNDSFFINYPFLHAENQILTAGNTYLLIKSSTSTGVELLEVALVDFFLKDDALYLIVEDLKTLKQFKLMVVLNNLEVKCQWILLDPNYLKKRITELYIKHYCCGYKK